VDTDASRATAVARSSFVGRVGTWRLDSRFQSCLGAGRAGGAPGGSIYVKSGVIGRERLHDHSEQDGLDSEEKGEAGFVLILARPGRCVAKLPQAAMGRFQIEPLAMA
jgi:hypothetical protein